VAEATERGNESLATDGENGPIRSPEFEAEVLSHIDILHAVALKLTRNLADAQDLTQSTLVKALRFHEKYQKGTYIKAWLLTILRNTFINEYRRKTRRPAMVELTGAEPAPTSKPETRLGHEHTAVTRSILLDLLEDEVKQAILELPKDFRDAVIMADLEDMSYKEIAERMDCPLGTVMSRLYRGRKVLREQLRDYAVEQRVIAE
jgi:RNA polymerase sigma-70 factor (ECF subfamily)